VGAGVAKDWEDDLVQEHQDARRGGVVGPGGSVERLPKRASSIGLTLSKVAVEIQQGEGHLSLIRTTPGERIDGETQPA